MQIKLIAGVGAHITQILTACAQEEETDEEERIVITDS